MKPIHNHPNMEGKLGVDEDHVIIDRDIFEELYPHIEEKIDMKLADRLEIHRTLHIVREALNYMVDVYHGYYDQDNIDWNLINNAFVTNGELDMRLF